MPASTATTLRTPAQADKINKARKKEGFAVPIPTHADIYRRWQWGKEHYKPRDETIRTYTSMVRLDSPFTGDKDDKAEKRVRTGRDGKTQYDVSNFPFNVDTLVQSLVANQHPNTSVLPTSARHTPKQMEDFDKFAQAMIDTRVGETDVMMDMASKLVATGWLVTYTPFDPMLKAQGKFPFDFQILDAINVYPMLDARRQPIWVCIESEVYGAQLLQDYGMFEGIAELADDEPHFQEGTSEHQKWQVDGSNLDTTKFKLVRYWDDRVTALLVIAQNAGTQACLWNDSLARMARKPYQSVLEGTGLDSAYAGVCPHNLGRVPVNIEGCWPEPVSHVADTSLDRSRWQGRIVYYPLLYATYDPWVLESKLMSMMHERMMDDIDPPITTDDTSFTNHRDKIWRITDGKKIEYAPRPPMPDVFMKFWDANQQQRDMSAFAPVGFGARGGATSGRQAETMGQAGTVRENIIIRKICRSWASYPTSAVRTMIERAGDGGYFAEGFFASGDSTKYGGSFTTTYKASALGGEVPRVVVELLDRDAITNPEKISIFKSLKGEVSDKLRLRKVLHVTNTDDEIKTRNIEQRDFFVMKNQDVLKPYTEKAALEAQLENQEEIWKLQEEADDTQATYDLAQRKGEIDDQMSLLPAQMQVQREEQALKALQQHLGITPPQEAGTNGPPSLPMPPNSGPIAGGPSSPLMSPGLPMIPPPGLPGMPLGAGPGSTTRPYPPVGGGLPPPPMTPPSPDLSFNGLPPGMMPPVAGGPSGPPIGPGTGLAPGVANAPGQMQQPVQPLSRFQPQGGVGRPGVDSLLAGPQGLPGQPGTMPRIEAANQAVEPIRPVAEPTLGHQRNKRKKRGSRGRKR